MSFEFSDFLILLVTGYLIYETVRAYRALSFIGSAYERIISALKYTAASLWTGFTVLVTVLIGWLAQLADFVNAPSVAGALTTYGSPKVVAGLMIAAALIAEYARRREQKP